MFMDCDIENGLWLFHISKWFGLFPFIVNTEGLFQRSLRLSVVSFTVLIIVLINNVLEVVTSDPYGFGDSWIFRFLSNFNFLAFATCPLVFVAELFLRLNEFNESINIMKLVYNAVYPIRIIKFSYNKTFVIIIVLSAFQLAYDAWSCFFIIFNVPKFLKHVLRVWVVFIVLVVVHRFFTVVDILASLFRRCNEEALLLPSAMPTKTTAKRLERLVWAHGQLCDCSDIITDIHSWQIFIITSIFFWGNVLTIYLIGDMMVRGTLSLDLMVTYFGWYCLLASIPWRIVDTCVKCENEAKKFNVLLYQLMINDKTNQISENKKLRLHISMKREVVFSACGFFNLDYTLIHSMVAAATTYLVILIQFGQPLNSAEPTEHPNTTLTTSSDISDYFTTPSWMYTTL